MILRITDWPFSLARENGVFFSSQKWILLIYDENLKIVNVENVFNLDKYYADCYCYVVLLLLLLLMNAFIYLTNFPVRAACSSSRSRPANSLPNFLLKR